MAANITLRQLRALCAITDTGSFTEAAKTLHLSQAALSGLIKELESQIGVRLLNRSTRQVTLSSVGDAFLPLARRVLNDLDDALMNLDNLKELRRGVVRVAAPEVLSCTLLPSLITAFSALYPGIDVKFEDVPIETVFSRLKSGEIDVGIAPAFETDADLETSILGSDPFWVALQADDALAAKSFVTWKDIRSYPVLTHVRRFPERVLSNVPAECQPARLKQVHRINTALALLRLNHGAAICPSMSAMLVRGFGLEFRPIVDPIVTRNIAAFVRKGISPSPALETFLEFSTAFTTNWAKEDQTAFSMP